MNINIETKELEKLGYEFDVSLDNEDFKKKYNNRLNYYKKNINIKGFRQGKVPMGIVKKRYGEDIKKEVANDLVPKIIQKALKEEDFEPVTQPDIKDMEIKDGIRVKFVAYSKPKIPELDLDGIDAQLDVEDVKKEEMNEEINKMLEQKVEYVEIEEDRKVEDGDHVYIDFEGYLKENDKKIEGGTAENTLYKVGEGNFIDDLDEGIEGMKQGKEKKIEVKFPEDYRADNLAGKDAYFNVKINEIVKKEYPELTDEIVQDISEHETVEELKKHIKEQIKESKEEEAKNELRKDVFEKVLEKNNDFELPGILIEQEKKKMKESNEDMDDEKIEEEVKTSLRSYFILNKISDDYDVDASDEINKQIERYAQYYGGDTEKTTKMLKDNGMLDRITYNTWEKKVVDTIISKVKGELENEDDTKETNEENEEVKDEK